MEGRVKFAVTAHVERAPSECARFVRTRRTSPSLPFRTPPSPFPRLPCKTGDDRRQLYRLNRLGYVHLETGR